MAVERKGCDSVIRLNHIPQTIIKNKFVLIKVDRQTA